MVWLSTWLRVRALRWLGIQAAIDGVIARAVREASEVDARAMREAAYAHEQFGKQALAINVLRLDLGEVESRQLRFRLTLDSHTEQLVEILTENEAPEAPRAIDDIRRGGWGAVVQAIEEREMRQAI